MIQFVANIIQAELFPGCGQVGDEDTDGVDMVYRVVADFIRTLRHRAMRITTRVLYSYQYHPCVVKSV